MQISATGISTNSSRIPIRGFTLIEIMVVMLIIGLMAAGMVLSLGTSGRDRQLEQERDRILALTDYLRDQASLQNREFGMRFFLGGYEFLAYDSRTARWERLVDDPVTRARHLPLGLRMGLHVEGRPVILPKEETKTPEPQVMLFSSGDLNLFEMTLQRDGAAGSVTIAPSATDGKIAATSSTGGGA
jgi:general secretion pathway protein H